MSEQRTIELTDLYLDFKGSKFPILSLQLQYYVGTPPSVEVIISTAINIDGTDASLDLIDDNLGNIASVCLTLMYHKDSSESNPGASTAKKLNLFCGYVISAQPALVCNAVSIASTKTLRLVSAVEALDATPLGILNYYSAEQFTRGQTPLPFAFLNQCWSVYQDYKLESNDFNEDASSYLVRFLSAERRIVENTLGKSAPSSDGQSVMTLENALAAIPATPTIQLEKNSNLQVYLHQYLSSVFASSSPTAIVPQVAHQFFLEWLPVTMGKFGDTVPCKMLVFPINAWDSDVCFTLEPGDMLDVRGVTNYKINSVVDCWMVSYNPQDGVDIWRQPIAIYGPGWRDAKGNATILQSLDDLRGAAHQGQQSTDTLRRQGKAVNSTFYLAARNVTMPTWLSTQGIMTYKESAAATKSGSSPNLAVNTNRGDIPGTIEEWAKLVAKQAFLLEGYSGRSARARIPLWRWLTLLPYLGRVGQMNILSTDSAKRAVNATDLETKKYFGMLSGLALTIQIDNKNISCQCSMQMSALRDENMQKEYGVENAFYTWDPTDLDAELGDAPELAKDLLALEGKSWGGNRKGRAKYEKQEEIATANGGSMSEEDTGPYSEDDEQL